MRSKEVWLGSEVRFAVLGLLASAALLCCSSGPGDAHLSSPGRGDLGSETDDPSSLDSEDEGSVEQEAEFCRPLPFPRDYRCEGEPGYWGEALQKALWFFHVQKSGPGIHCTQVQWRGDSHLADSRILLKADDPNGVDMSEEYINKYRSVLDPDGDGAVDLGGGFYDAGDFIKFGLTNGFAASTLAWALYEFPSSFEDTGLETEALGLLRWAGDYFLRSTFIEDDTLPAKEWNVIAFAHQVGDASDHTCGWMPPELRSCDSCPRAGYFATHERPAADVTANNAAALAQISLAFLEEDPAYSRRCLEYAAALYRFAAQYPTSKATSDGGLYTSEYAADDLAWAAIWLHIATKDDDYLNDAIGDQGFLNGMGGFQISCAKNPDASQCWSESHTHCWNSLRSGVFVKLAHILSTRKDALANNFRNIARDDTMRWVLGPHSPGGFALKVSNTWGSGRYNSAGQFVALVYAKYFPEDKDIIIPWAQSQSRYLLGENPLGKSYMMGFSDHYASQPHHAGGHASIYGEVDLPKDNRHILWGGLVSGPQADDSHVDQRSDYGQNEVAIDYNAAFVAALAANTFHQGKGQCPLRDFPPIEAPIDEFYTRGRVNTTNECRSQVEILMINESIHPPRFNDRLTARYYIDVTELKNAGVDPKSIDVSVVYDNGAAEFEQPTRVEGPIPCEENADMYYFVLSYEGYDFWGEQVRLKGPRKTLMDFGMANGDSCPWDPKNDWSFEALSATFEKSPHITAYSSDETGEDKLVWGQEPDCHGQQTEIIPPLV